MSNRTDELIARIEALLLSETPDSDALHTATAALLTQFNRQSRQIDRLVKLADASEEKLTRANASLSALTRNLARFETQFLLH